LVGKTVFANTYKYGSINVWIAKKDYRVIKADLELNFEATEEDAYLWGGANFRFKH